MRNFLIPVFLILLLTNGYLYLPIAAVAASSPLTGSIAIQQSQATPDFPNSIKFDLTAKVAANAGVQKITLNYQLVGGVATSVRSAEITPTATLTKAQASIDTKRAYIPPGTHVSFYWEFTDKSNTVYDSPTQETVYQDKRFPFQELSGGVVTVRWYQGNQAFGKAALDKALATIDRLGREYNIKPTKAINITIYPDTQSMFTALPPNTAEWVGGQAIPTLGTIVLAIPPGNISEVNRSIPHEVTHQVNYQATKNPYNYLPKWLDEGLAVYNQDQVDAFLNQAFQRGIDKQSLIPLRVLDGSFPADPQQSYLAYGESVNVIKYILNKYGSAGLGRILASFKDGVSYDEAVQTGLGIGLDELDREWKQSMGYPVGATGQTNSSPAVTTNSAVNSSPAVVSGKVVGQAVIINTSVSQPQPAAKAASNTSAASVVGSKANVASSTTPAQSNNDNAALLLIIMGCAALVAIVCGFSLLLMGRRD